MVWIQDQTARYVQSDLDLRDPQRMSNATLAARELSLLASSNIYIFNRHLQLKICDALKLSKIFMLQSLHNKTEATDPRSDSTFCAIWSWIYGVRKRPSFFACAAERVNSVSITSSQRMGAVGKVSK